MTTRPSSPSTMIIDEELGYPTVVYLKLPDDEDARKIRDILPRIKYNEEYRTSGLPTRSRIFGFSPRITIRRDFCNATSLQQDAPQAAALITQYATKVARYYQEFHPELYAKHQGLADKVLEEWKIKDSPFTSGIINQNNVLPYHHDSGNFKNVWSNMLAFKEDVQGGHLSVPEYDIGLEICDNSLTMFDGQNLLHGVTPMKRMTTRAFRYTIVYYSLQQMWQCLPAKDEVKRIQKLRTQREMKRAGKGEA